MPQLTFRCEFLMTSPTALLSCLLSPHAPASRALPYQRLPDILILAHDLSDSDPSYPVYDNANRHGVACSLLSKSPGVLSDSKVAVAVPEVTAAVL